MIRLTDKKHIPEILELFKEDTLKMAGDNYMDEAYLINFFDEGLIFAEISENNKIDAIVLLEKIIGNGVLWHFAIIKKELRGYQYASKIYDKCISLMKEFNFVYILSYVSPIVKPLAERKGFLIGGQYAEIVKIL